MKISKEILVRISPRLEAKGIDISAYEQNKENVN